MTKIRKAVLIVLSIISLTNLNAQFDFNTGKDVSLEITQAYETIDVHCVPNPISDIIITWDLIEISSSVPPEWDFTICDQICYPFFPNHGNQISFTANQFTNGEHYKLKLGVSVNGVEGSGYVKYYISDVNNSSYGDTVIFHLNFQSNSLNTNESDESIIKSSFTEDKLSLFSSSDEVIQYNLYSTEGTLLLNSKFKNQTTSDINLKPGIYFLLINDQKTIQIINF